MKVNEQSSESKALNIPKPQSERLFAATKPNLGSTASTNRTETPSDRIELGSQDGLVARVQDSGSTERATRVEQLRALVQSGQYHVDTAALSKSIIGATLNGY